MLENENLTTFIPHYNYRIPELLEKYLKENDFESLLEIGCGFGYLLDAMKKKGYLREKNVFAVDYSKKRVAIVSKLDKSFFCYANEAGDLKNIDTESIDFIVSEQVIEHVPDDAKMISESARVMRGGGTIYISTVFKKWYGWYFYRNKGKWVLESTHEREYAKESELFNKFRSSGFEIIEEKKTLLWFPVIDFFLRRIPTKRELKGTFWNLLRKISVPIIGYYNWEITAILKK